MAMEVRFRCRLYRTFRLMRLNIIHQLAIRIGHINTPKEDNRNPPYSVAEEDMDDLYADEHPGGVAVGGGPVVVIPVSAKRLSVLPNSFGHGRPRVMIPFILYAFYLHLSYLCSVD